MHRRCGRRMQRIPRWCATEWQVWRKSFQRLLRVNIFRCLSLQGHDTFSCFWVKKRINWKIFTVRYIRKCVAYWLLFLIFLMLSSCQKTCVWISCMSILNGRRRGRIYTQFDLLFPLADIRRHKASGDSWQSVSQYWTKKGGNCYALQLAFIQYCASSGI